MIGQVESIQKQSHMWWDYSLLNNNNKIEMQVSEYTGIDVFYSDFIFNIFSFPIPFSQSHSIFEYI